LSVVRRGFAVTAWLALLVGVLVVFTLLGSGALAPPPVTDPGVWGAWASQRGATEVVFALLRIGVVAVAWYLLGVSVIGVAVRLLRLGRLVRVADIVTVPAVRRLLQGALGLGLATAAVTAGSAPGRVPGATAAAAVAAEPAVGSSAEVALLDTGVALPGAARLTMNPLGARGASFAVMRQVGPPSPSPWVQRDEAAPDRAWEVQPGEHLWAIAERTLAQAWGRAPTDAEIEPYWNDLVAHNRDALADPANPDLVYPGQVFGLPPVPSPDGEVHPGVVGH